METSKAPRVFISYSWESEDHKSWVRYLCEKLYQAGIEARLDQWFVHPGESFTAFMEQEVVAADFVLVVCTPSYAQKSNNRHGGVGYEQQIVSSQLMSGVTRSKFIPILRKGEDVLGPDCAIPTHFLGIAWIDFRNEDIFEKSLEDLVRVILSKPRFGPPPLGIPPILETISATPWMKEGSADGENHVKELVRQGKNHSDSGEFEAAVAVYDNAIELRPDDADAYYNRGIAHYKNGEMDPATADFSNAIELRPDDADAYYNRGIVYNAKGNTDRAIADFSKAIELSPDYAQAYGNRGIAYSNKGDTDRAVADYGKAIELSPDYASAYYNRGIAYNEKGNKARAIADFRKSLTLFTDPDHRENALRQLRRIGAEVK